MTSRIVFLVDVDNTLLDNDGVKREMDRQLDQRLGAGGAAEFWRMYEEVRSEESVVDIPRVLARFAPAKPAVSPASLADLFLAFPFADFLLPGALATLAHLRTMGRVAILSDGDPVYQMSKILRSGLAAATDGHVLVFRHKEDHVLEITAAFAAAHYVAIDDKPHVLARLAERMAAPLTTVFVRQGHYAETVPPGRWPGAGITVASIAEVATLSGETLLAGGRGHPGIATDGR